jgi:putative SOS response-associated peptidase YedK
MCGRFTATFSFRDIKVRWNLQGDLSFEPRYNIAPSQSVPVIIKGERGNEAKLIKLGLVPSWAPDPSIGNRMINARAETLLVKPSFRRLVSQRRCLIPADGFYECVRREVACVIVRRRQPTEPAAPSAVPYEERRIGNEPSKSPRTMNSSV